MKQFRKLLVVLLPVILLSLMSAESGRAQTKPWVTAYVGGWDLNYDNNGSMPISGINFKGMTVCDHMSILPAASGTFLDTVNAYMTQANSSLLIAAAHANGVKVTVTMGAWGTESAFLTATNSTNLSTFVANLVAFVKERGYDGVDIDWEPFTATDASQWEGFIKALRQALPSPQYLITVTSAWGEPYSAFAAVQSYVDQINLMTYDFDTDAPGYNSWYAAPVYSNGVTVPANGSPVPSCDWLVGQLKQAGVQASKIGIGTEPGGCLWQGITGVGQPYSSSTKWTEDVSYNTIMSQYYNSSLYHYDSGAQATYLSSTSGNWFLSYDDTTALKAKLNYINTAGIGGIIIYEIGMSYSNGTNPFLNVTQEFLQNGSSPVQPPAGPTVSITSPANGSTESGTISLSADVTDNSTITGVTFKVDGSQIGNTVTAVPYSVSENTTSLSNGSHTITAAATDAAGGSATASVTVTVSNTVATPDPPTVSFTSPSNSATVSGTVTLSANASSNSGIAKVQFRCDNRNAGSAVTAAPYSTTMSTTSIANGSHTLYATAYDPAGDSAVSSITVNVSNTTPLPSTTGLAIYQNSLSSPWINASYGTTVNFSNTSPVYSGSQYSIQVVNNAWGTLYLHDGNWGSNNYVNSSSYNNLTFWVYSSQRVSFMVFLGNDAGQKFPSVNAQSIPQSQWTLVSIPLTQLNPSNYNVQDIGIMESSGKKRTYYVDGITLTSTAAAPTTPPSVTPSSSSFTSVYGDSLLSPWMDVSWSATVNYSNASPVFSGANSIQVVASSWGALSMHYGAWGGSATLSPAGYDTVRFEVYSSSPVQLALNLENDLGSSFTEVSLGSIAANGWTLVSVPVSQLDPSNSDFTRIDIINSGSSSATFYVDNIQLVQTPAAGNQAVTSVQSSAVLPKIMALQQNYPNPFNPSTTIGFVLPNDSHVTLKVYNVLGQEVASLADGFFQAGVHAVVWNPGRLASGIYIYQIRTDKESISKRMMYLK